MADSSDVEAAIVGLIVGALYPNGTSRPGAIASICSVERGWPTEADIRQATTSGKQIIRVHAVSGMGADAERYLRIETGKAGLAPTLQVSLADPVATFSGASTAGLVVAVVSGGHAYSYTTVEADTPTSVAAAVAALITGATASGADVTLPDSGGIPIVGVFASGVGTIEIGRERQMFNISVWATSPDLRDAIMRTVNPALALTYRMTMPDGTTAIRIGKAIQFSGPDDMPSRAQVWRRDVRLAWEYPITLTQTLPPVAITTTTVTPKGQTFPFVTRTQ